MLLGLFLVAAAIANKASASSATACAEISSSYEKWAAHGGKGNFAGIPGQAAYDCLRSMPFRHDLASKFLDEYKGYLQFHSTLEILKNPPISYISPSIDLVGAIDRIQKRVKDGYFTSQYDFDSDLRDLVYRANDGHLQLGLCSLEIMHFEHDIPLVSISKDGLQLPDIYTVSDARLKINGFEDVSPVVEINGVDAVYFLEAYIAITSGLQDPDARYNRLFPSATANFSGVYSGGSWTAQLGLWPGSASQTLTFANRTTLQIPTTASWPSTNGPMTYLSGEELFNIACMPDTKRILGTYPGIFLTQPKFPIPLSGPAAYPRPVINHPQDLIRGYYGPDTSIAVLQVPTFHLGSSSTSFAQTATTFLKRASRDEKTKLIIDLSSNYGGNIVPGFNLFRIFFPNEPIYSATRFRATELIGLMGKVFSTMYGKEAPLDLPLVFQNAVDTKQKKKFGSWEELYGPYEIRGDRMSSSYAEFDFDTASTREDPVNGFGGIPLDPVSSLFKAQDIIIMTDGHCASTCAIFAHLMKSQGVRTLAFGGRPRHGPMQAIGGVKGAQHLTLRTLSKYITEALSFSASSSIPSSILSPSELARFKSLAPPPVQNFSLRFDTYGESSVNFRNAYAENDGETPLQFLYEAADCRLFLRAENYFHPETKWDDVVRAIWGDGGCVQ